MPPTPSDWLNIANIGTSLFGGFAQGKQSERQANESAQDFLLRQQQEAYRQAVDAYTRRMSARSGIGMALQDQNLARQSARQSTLNASPLGAEQSLAMQMARARGLSTQAEGFQPTRSQDPAIASRMGALPNMLGAFTTSDYRNTISPEATARSIAERRKAIGGVDPDFQFGNMGDYGLPNLGGEVSSYQNKIGADRLGRENQLMQLLTNQMEEASKPLYQDPGAASSFGPTAPTAPAEETKKKGSPWWKKVLKVAAAAAPIVAAPFTGGTSLAMIGAGAGALSGALDGGKKGALTGGLMGGATAGLGGGAAGNAAKRVAGESVKSALQRAIVNPRALTTIGGSAASAFGGDSAVGKLGTAAQAVSPFLRGARPGMVAGFENQMPKGWQGPQQLPESLGPGMTGFDPNFNSPAPVLASTRAPQYIAPQGANLQSMGIGDGRPVAVNRPRVQGPQGLSPMRPVASHSPFVAPPPMIAGTMGANRPTAMRANTLAEQYGVNLNAPLGTPLDQPYADSPLAQGQPPMFAQVARTPVGAAILGSMAMPFNGAVASPQLALPGRAPQLALPPSSLRPGLPSGPSRPGLPAGRYPMPQSNPTGPFPMGPGRQPLQMPQTTATGMENQGIASRIMEAMKGARTQEEYQFWVTQLQPYLRGIR
jgi:hypothetical protein